MSKKLALFTLAIIGFIFLPTSIFLGIGMIPTIVCFITDRTVARKKTISVACMNFAGCFPFLLDFWTADFGQQTIANALTTVLDLQTLIVIFALAAGGYAIDMAVTGITASFIIQKSERRLKKINVEQKKLVTRWGEKVTGQYQLDDYGFPVDPIPVKNAPPAENTNNDTLSDQ